jgi:hypothetical protein
MPFVAHRTMKGLFYVPPTSGTRRKKYSCPDCFYCQWCSEQRCGLCRTCRPAESQEEEVPHPTKAREEGHHRSSR